MSRLIKEKWSNANFDFFSLIPSQKIKNIMGFDSNIKLLLDNDVREKEPIGYNISIIARAHNERMFDKLQKYYGEFSDTPKFSTIMGIELPQVLLEDSLGYNEPLISIHITKLTQNELFLNDIVLVKNLNLESIGNGVFSDVLKNLINFAKTEKIKFISGYAVNYEVLKKFKAKGFIEDKREDKGNDLLWEMAMQSHGQFPFYKIIE